jgi:MHS family proline/betaine transporter-like MFS transporter
LSLGYNFAVTIFGGFAPFIATSLIAYSGSNLAPTYYVIVANFISLIAVGLLARRASK